MVRVALGKSHGCSISADGKVFTFGVNNKGQCGRGSPSSDAEKDGKSCGMCSNFIENFRSSPASCMSLYPTGCFHWYVQMP